MNAMTGFVTIVSLLLALAMAGNATKDQANVEAPARNITPSRIAINHNETMVSDATSIQQADAWSQWLTSARAFIFNSFTNFARDDDTGDECEPWGCGSNHNETMVSVATIPV